MTHHVIRGNASQCQRPICTIWPTGCLCAERWKHQSIASRAVRTTRLVARWYNCIEDSITGWYLMVLHRHEHTHLHKNAFVLIMSSTNPLRQQLQERDLVSMLWCARNGPPSARRHNIRPMAARLRHSMVCYRGLSSRDCYLSWSVLEIDKFAISHVKRTEQSEFDVCPTIVVLCIHMVTGAQHSAIKPSVTGVTDAREPKAEGSNVVRLIFCINGKLHRDAAFHLCKILTNCI